MRRTATFLASMAVWLLLVSMAMSPVWAQQETWNQEQVTALASQMADEVKRMRVAVRKEPHIVSAGNPTKQRTAKVYVEKLRILGSATGKLSRQLAAGETREQTTATARRIDSLLRDVRQQSAKLHSTDWTNRHLDPALGLAAQLRAFYGVATVPVEGQEAVSE